MDKQETPDQPITQEPDLPQWSPPMSPSFGGSGWLAMLFERFGFVIASLLTIGILAILFIDTDLLLRKPDHVSSQAAAEEQPALPEAQRSPALTMPAEEADTTAAATVSLSIVTDPASAAVFVDGELMGVAPLTEVVLAQGRHLISVQKTDYVQLDTVVTFSEASASFVFSLREAEPAFAAVSDETTLEQAPPTPAQDETTPPASNPAQPVSLPETEQADRQQTAPPTVPAETLPEPEPSTDPQQPPADTEDPAAEEEEEPAAQVDERPSSTVNDPLEQDRTPGTLKILATPWGDIYIDDTLHKRGADVRYTTQLPPGTYRVRVEHPSLGIWTQKVTLAAGEERIVNVNFNPDDQ